MVYVNPELGRFHFTRVRDGEEDALEAMRQVVCIYRAVVLRRKTHTMYRRQLIERYVGAKRILEGRL